jgi:CheY-like chemotaxis protein
LKPVLVVDDEEDARAGLAERLEEAGYAAVAVASAAEAFDFLIRQGEPLCLLLDLMMPGKTGGEFLEELRQDSKLARIPVVVVTAAEEVPVGLPADAVLKKPINGAELIRVVAALATHPVG